MEFNFPERAGSGLESLLLNAPKDCIDLLKLLLAYDPEDRITAEQALRHEYFRELWEAEWHRDFTNSLYDLVWSPTDNFKGFLSD